VSDPSNRERDRFHTLVRQILDDHRVGKNDVAPEVSAFIDSGAGVGSEDLAAVLAVHPDGATGRREIVKMNPHAGGAIGLNRHSPHGLAIIQRQPFPAGLRRGIERPLDPHQRQLRLSHHGVQFGLPEGAEAVWARSGNSEFEARRHRRGRFDFGARRAVQRSQQRLGVGGSAEQSR